MNDIIQIKKRGSFHVGGEKVTLSGIPIEEYAYQGNFTYKSDPNGSHWTKQMYVQYSEVAEPKTKYPIMMWHGGGLTGVTYETTPDGREGWDTLFLRMNYNVYISDAVERGRASWAKFPEINPIPPIFHTYEARWLNLRFGETYPTPYVGCRFPTDCYDNFMMQSVPRWMTSDEWTKDAYIAYIEKMKEKVDGIIILAHSQAAFLACEIAQEYTDFVKALVLVEMVSIPSEEVTKNISQIPQLYVYGDYMEDDRKVVHPWVEAIRPRFFGWKNTLEKYNTNYKWINLPDMGIFGNSHMLMMDDNNDEIARMIDQWLDETL